MAGLGTIIAGLFGGQQSGASVAPPAPSSYSASGPSVSGAGALPGATIQVFDGTTSLGTTTASSTGAWTLMLASALGTGSHSLTAKQTPVPAQSSASSVLATTVSAPANNVTYQGAAVTYQGATVTYGSSGGDLLSFIQSDAALMAALASDKAS